LTTALEKYAKLEAVALYDDGSGAEPREVVLSFGARTLVMLSLDDQAVGHWPLASLRALGDPDAMPMELGPDLTGHARIVLDDAEMISAIRAVCPDLDDRPRVPRRVHRTMRWFVAAVALFVFLLFFLVPVMAERFAGLVAPARARALGEVMAATLAGRLSTGDGVVPGRCIDPDGIMALARMVARLRIDAGPPLHVSIIDHPDADMLLMPGGRLLVFRGMIDRARSPDEIAAVMAHAMGHLARRDPTRNVLRGADTFEVMALVAGDILGAPDIRAATEAILNTRHDAMAEHNADVAAYRILGAAGLPAMPISALAARLPEGAANTAARPGYAVRHAGTPGRAGRAATADQVGDRPFTPVLDDRTWIALGNICDRVAPFDPVPET